MRFAVVLLLAAAALGGDEWRCARGNLANTGVVKNRGPKKTPKVVWKKEEKGTITTGAALAAGKLVYGVGDGLVACRWQSDGSTVWDFEVKQAVKAWPAIVEELIFFGGQDRVHYRVKFHEGTEPATAEAESAIVADPCVTEDHYLAGATDGYFYAMGSKTGSLLWRREIGPVSRSAALARGKVYVVNDVGVLYAFALKGGKQLWKYEAKAKPLAAPMLSTSEVLLVLPDRVQAVALKGGTPGKSHETKGIAGAPVLDRKMLYYGTTQGEVVALELKSGKQRARVKVSGSAVSMPLILARKILYGAAGETLFAVDPKARRLLWSYKGEEPFGPPIVADGAILVAAGSFFYRLR